MELNTSLNEEVEKGTDLFNRRSNKLGCVLDGADCEEIVVITVSGKETWKLADCDIVE